MVGFRVSGSGFGVKGLGFGMQGLGFLSPPEFHKVFGASPDD